MVGIKNFKRKSPEHVEQVKFVQYVRTFHPELVCMAIPNGADVSASQRIRLVHEGMMAGAPDVFLLGKGLPTLAIEFKRPDGLGRVSEAQQQAHVQMEAVGVQIAVCESCHEAKKVLTTWLVSV
jgi:hypothetical protein